MLPIDVTFDTGEETERGRKRKNIVKPYHNNNNYNNDNDINNITITITLAITIILIMIKIIMSSTRR